MSYHTPQKIIGILLAGAMLLPLLAGCTPSAEKHATQVGISSEGQALSKDPTQLLSEEPEPEPLPHEEPDTPADDAPAPDDAPADDTPAAPVESTMAQLQQSVQAMVNSYSGVWSVYVKRLDTGESFVINDSSMVAASLIKLYVYGAIGQAEESGQIASGSYDNTLSSMITVSDNDACNLLIDVLGKEAINQFIQNQGYWQTALNRKMLSGEPVENYTSVSECGRLLEQVYTGSFVSARVSSSLLTALQNQTRRWKIPAGLPGGTLCANKTGELSDVENDVAIVYGPSCTYILCVMSDGVAPGTAQVNIQNISAAVYSALNG